MTAETQTQMKTFDSEGVGIEEALMELKWGRFQWLLFATCGIGYGAEIIELLLLSFAIPELKIEWNLDNDQAADASMWLNIGTMIGAFSWGVIADWIGRRSVFIGSVGLTFVAGVLCAFAPEFWLFVLGRFFVGVGIGGNLAVDFCLFMEFVPLHLRQQVMMMLTMWGVAGVGIIAIAARCLIEPFGWRWYVGILALPSLILFGLRMGMPESPTLLYAAGKHEEAMKALQHIAAYNKSELPAGLKLKAFVPDDEAQGTPQNWQETMKIHVTRSLVPLSMPYIRTTLKFGMVWFLLSFAYGGFTLWLPSFLTEKGITGSDIYTTYGIMVGAEVPSLLISTYLVWKGVLKRHVLTVCFLGCAGSMVLCALVTNEYGIRIVLGFGYFFMVSAWACIYVLTPEAYPATCRGTASGTLRIFSSAASTMKGKVGARLIEAGSLVPVWVYGACFLLALFVAPFLPDVTNIRSVVKPTKEAAAELNEKPAEKPAEHEREETLHL